MEKNAPSIIERQPVNESVETGVKFVDSMIPIGCGQRELIIGDPKTGKSSIAVDAILNQKNKGIICVYVAIGQRASGVKRLHELLKVRGCLDYTVIVSATAADSSVMQYLAPFAGTAIAESFMKFNAKVLIIYDDLSKHAVAYRQMSLLLRRPPGREGYPGDVFYLHSRLLERSARLVDHISEKTGDKIIWGSLTGLPIVETIDGDVSAYIPTNVISITDGQIYLEKELFNQGILPAISPGISVSRVGSSAQSKIMKEISGSLKLELAQYTELAEFANLGLYLDEHAINILVKGERLQWTMIQEQYSPVDLVAQICVLIGSLNGMFNNFKISDLKAVQKKVSFNFLRDGLINRVLKYSIREFVEEIVVKFPINFVKGNSFDKSLSL